jgi:toxin ParE1/3/4
MKPLLLQFTPDALQDLDDLDKYLLDKSPQGLKNVIAAIKNTLLQIQQYPSSGRISQNGDIRIAIEPHYKFVLPYYVGTDTIWVLRVYNSRRSPIDYVSLELPEVK